MASKLKHDRFKKIAASRCEKINDMLRLLGNCANKGNYAYSEAEAEAIFASIESNLLDAKLKYESFRRNGMNNTFRTEFENGFTWIGGFMRCVEYFPNRKAVICPDKDRAYTYAEVNDEVNKCANAMINAGVGRGDRVMYQIGNCPEFVFIYAACRKIGAVGCPVNTRLSSEKTASIIDFARPSVFFCRNGGELAARAAAHKPYLVIIGCPERKRAPKNRVSYEEFTRADLEEPNVKRASDIYSETTLFYTSGTAGSQKCVPVTDLNEVLSTHEIMRLLSVTSDDVMMNLSHWAHRGGLHCCGPATALYAGAAIIAADEPSPSRCLEYVERYGATLISGSPPALRILAMKQEREGRNLASVKRVISVGSILSGEESLRIRRSISPRVYNGYGTTETFINTILTPFEQQFHSGTVGMKCIDDEVRIVKIRESGDASPNELVARDGETRGEIIIRSRSKSAGYYKSNTSSEGSCYKDGFLYTRDIGTWDKNGIISVIGRRDDMIVCGGEKVYPDEIENFLCRHEGIEDCIVTSVPRENGDEAIVAYIVRSNNALEAEEIDKYCRESRDMADVLRPHFYRFKKTLPRTSNGKKQHKKARSMASSDMKKGKLTEI